MVSWYQASERRRSRADLTRRHVRRALSASSSASASFSAPYSAPNSGTASARSRISAGTSSRASLGGIGSGGIRATASKGEAAAANMSPLKGRSLRLSYGGAGAGGASAGRSSSSNSRALVPASNEQRTPSSLPFQRSSSAIAIAIASDDRVPIDPLTAHAIQIETLDLGLPASVYAIAQALSVCPQVRLLHGQSSYGDGQTNERAEETGGAFGDEFSDENLNSSDCYYSYQEEETPAERTDRRIGQLRTALNGLASRVGSITQIVESWDEAKVVLSEALVFPDEYEAGRKNKHEMGGEEGEEENEVEEDLDELEKEQRALEQGEGTIVSIPSSNTKKKRVGTVSSLIHRRSNTPQKRSLVRSTKRVLTKAVRRANSATHIVSTARRNFLTKASYARMLMQQGQLERMHRFKVLTSTVVPPPMVSVVPPPAVSLMGEEGAMQEEETEEERQKQREAAEAAAEARAKAIAALSGLARIDHLADQRVVEAEQLARARVDAEAARQDAEMAAREQAEQEAEVAAAAQANRASTLLRDLTDEEAEIVRDAIYGIGRPDEILATSDTDSVQRQSLHKLQPGVWLNDEVIHYFLLMLARRDAELAAKQPGRKRCHFFKSFFITKLLDEAGGYNYKNVKRWSRKVPGKDIFALDKIFFPGECGTLSLMFFWSCLSRAFLSYLCLFSRFISFILLRKYLTNQSQRHPSRQTSRS